MKSLEDLLALRDKARAEMGIRTDVDDAAVTRVMVGMATCGIAAGARPVLQTLVDEVGKEKIENVVVSQTGCVGICQYEPVVEIYAPEGDKTTYVNMTPERAIKIVHQHLMEGIPVRELTIGEVDKVGDVQQEQAAHK